MINRGTWKYSRCIVSLVARARLRRRTEKKNKKRYSFFISVFLFSRNSFIYICSRAQFWALLLPASHPEKHKIDLRKYRNHGSVHHFRLVPTSGSFLIVQTFKDRQTERAWTLTLDFFCSPLVLLRGRTGRTLALAQAWSLPQVGAISCWSLRHRSRLVGGPGSWGRSSRVTESLTWLLH